MHGISRRGFLKVAAGSAAALPAIAWAAAGPAAPKEVRLPADAEIKKMEQAAPGEPIAKPANPRKVLVWGRMEAHEPVPFAAKALEVLGRKSGAFEAVVSGDPAVFLAADFANFDAIVMNNVHQRDPFLPADIKSRPQAEQETLQKQNEAIHKAIIDFLSGGKGIVGIHAATAAFQSWPEYGEMMGGYYTGHLVDEVPLKIEDPASPLCAMFPAGFKIKDEIYLFRDPYSRAKLRVLLSLDMGQMADPGKRPDKDYAVTWVREYGKGRVFYCSLGHASDVYWNPVVLKHYLAGIQFAAGDLKADAAPRK
jgi:type 1 glutamine amidotransferase